MSAFVDVLASGAANIFADAVVLGIAECACRLVTGRWFWIRIGLK